MYLIILKKMGFANFTKLWPDARNYINPKYLDLKNRKQQKKQKSLLDW